AEQRQRLWLRDGAVHARERGEAAGGRDCEFAVVGEPGLGLSRAGARHASCPGCDSFCPRAFARLCGSCSMLLFHCRAGFEADCAAEVSTVAREAGAAGRCEFRSGDACVVWHPPTPPARRAWIPEYAELVFARQMLTYCRVVDVPAAAERLQAVFAAVTASGRRYSTVWVEAPDADGPRQLLAGARHALEPLQPMLQNAGRIVPRSP